jgi:hypothetical protein
MIKQRILCLTILLLCLVTNTFAQSHRNRASSKPKRPTAFKVDEELAQQLIRDSENVKDVFRNLYGGNLKTFLEQSLPKGELLYLTKDGQPSLVVFGPRELAGRNSPTWLYRKTQNGYVLLLSGVNGFKPLRTWTNSYHDLESSGGIGAFETYTIIYKFDGRHYQESKKTTRRYN